MRQVIPTPKANLGNAKRSTQDLLRDVRDCGLLLMTLIEGFQLMEDKIWKKKSFSMPPSNNSVD